MSNKVFIINGNNFSTRESFYKEIDKVLTKDLDFETGHNLNAFNDILWGGFGAFEYEENIRIVWKNFERSEKKLGKELTDILVEKIKEHRHHIEFEKD